MSFLKKIPAKSFSSRTRCNNSLHFHAIPHILMYTRVNWTLTHYNRDSDLGHLGLGLKFAFLTHSLKILMLWSSKHTFSSKFLQIITQLPFKGPPNLGTCVAQSVQCPTLDFGSGHDLSVHAQHGVCLRFSPSAHPHACSLSLKINKENL